MAVVKANTTTKLILRVATGTSASGATIYSGRTISNVTPTVTDTVMYNVGTMLASLQNRALDEIRRQDTADIVEE